MRVAFYTGPELTEMSHAKCLKRVGYPGVVEAILLQDDDDFCCDVCLGSDADAVPMNYSAIPLDEALAILRGDSEKSLDEIPYFIPGDHGPRCDCADCLVRPFAE